MRTTGKATFYQACFTKLKFLAVFARLSSSIEVEELSAKGDDMPSFSTDVLRRYGCAILSVALAVVTRLALNPILGNRYPFFLFFIAVVLPLVTAATVHPS